MVASVIEFVDLRTPGLSILDAVSTQHWESCRWVWACASINSGWSSHSAGAVNWASKATRVRLLASPEFVSRETEHTVLQLGKVGVQIEQSFHFHEYGRLIYSLLGDSRFPTEAAVFCKETMR